MNYKTLPIHFGPDSRQAVAFSVFLLGVLFVDQISMADPQHPPKHRPSYDFEMCAIEHQKVFDQAMDQCDLEYEIENDELVKDELLNMCQRVAHNKFDAALKRCPKDVGRGPKVLPN